MTVVLTHDGDVMGRVPTLRCEQPHAFLELEFVDLVVRSVKMQATHKRAGSGWDLIAVRCASHDEPFLRNHFDAQRARADEKANRRPA